MLTPQREKFAREVASGKSQADAYRTAYPRALKWKEEAVWSQASRLMADSEVAARVSSLVKMVEQEFAIETSELLRETSRIAFSDIRKTMRADGTYLPPAELDEDTARAVSSFEDDGKGKIRYRFWDKNVALEKLFKHQGLFEKDNKQKSDPLKEFILSLGGNIATPVPGSGLPDSDDDRL